MYAQNTKHTLITIPCTTLCSGHATRLLHALSIYIHLPKDAHTVSAFSGFWHWLPNLCFKHIWWGCSYELVSLRQNWRSTEGKKSQCWWALILYSVGSCGDIIQHPWLQPRHPRLFQKGSFLHADCRSTKRGYWWLVDRIACRKLIDKWLKRNSIILSIDIRQSSVTLDGSNASKE